METDQFDESLGGAERLPHSANSLRFATSRSVEIAAMTESILRPSMTRLIFQTLPVHMRRRVMSHNCNRLPRKLRIAHLDQLKKSGLPPKQKRPSRKYRRRPGNLLQEYNRRKQNNIWLETHIWHAKRFHMVTRWGHKIGYSPCDKAFRACFRATSAHCLMQDMSYYVPIEINGQLADIKNVFQNITNSVCHLGICSKAYTSGSREGFIHLYRPNQFPFDYIGKINYLWQPGESPLRTLCLFVHPAIIKEVKLILNELCLSNSDNDSIPEKRRKITNGIESNIHIKYLDQFFNIFRLTGPNSQAILTKSLKCIKNLDQIKTNTWVATHFANSAAELRLEEKAQYWQNIQLASSPAQLPAHIVLGLVVRDPRLSRPQLRTKAINIKSEMLSTETLLSVPNYLATSSLWNLDILQTIKDNRLSNAQFIDRITKTQIVPGEVYENDPELQSIPVVLVQRSGSQNSDYKKIGYGCGWDVIVPSGYGLPFWQTFIMFGARAGGLRETESLAFEMGECYLPPDSSSGREEEHRIEKEMRERYFKLPPSKRVNYIKLGINSPFLCQWNVLLNDWSDSQVEHLFVLRDKALLAKLQTSVEKILPLPPVDDGNSCLIPIYVQMVQKGNLKRHSLICLPIGTDLTSINTLLEPLHKDYNEDKRRLFRKEHKKAIKSLRRKRRKLKEKMRTNKTVTKRMKRSKQEPSDYVLKMRDLWVPPSVKSVRNTCSRELIGYLSNGAFSFSEAQGCGVGYMPYNALKKILEGKQNNVLIRNTCSRKYRLESFDWNFNFGIPQQHDTEETKIDLPPPERK